MVVHVVQHMIQFHVHIIFNVFVQMGMEKYLLGFFLNLMNIKFRYSGLFCQQKQQCPTNFYGPNCTIQCIAPNTCSDGHFYCNSEGVRTCLPGWSPSNTCLIKNISSSFDSECPISTGCLNGGSCFNDSCCCPSNYTGKVLFSFFKNRKTLTIWI